MFILSENVNSIICMVMSGLGDGFTLYSMLGIIVLGMCILWCDMCNLGSMVVLCCLGMCRLCAYVDECVVSCVGA